MERNTLSLSENIWDLRIKSEKEGLDDDEIVKLLLEARGIKGKGQVEEFFDPKKPDEITLKEIGINENEVQKVVERVACAKKKKEKVIVFGDYDADGVCATAILWETLFERGIDAMPYIPDRFEEGYGIKEESIVTLKKDNPEISLIITVDNGIVAKDAIAKANNLGIDVIVTDHHEKEKTLPKALALLHTEKISGAGIAWFLAREIDKRLKTAKSRFTKYSILELAGIGTITDLMPLLGVNRSLAKYGLEALAKTKRPGLKALFSEAAIDKNSLSVYSISHIIGPRINAMGRLKHAKTALKLLCTRSRLRAEGLAVELGMTNKKRQEMTQMAIALTTDLGLNSSTKSVIVLAHEEFHEGIIGLVASDLAEKFNRPAIVIAKKEELSKASARSICGYHITNMIKSHSDLLANAGGHAMAAGFTIPTQNIGNFRERVNNNLLPQEILQRKIRADICLSFKNISWDLVERLKAFEPTGVGNPKPSFLTGKIVVKQVRAVGREAKHLKLVLAKDGLSLDAIAFGFGQLSREISSGVELDAIYNLEENIFNGNRSLQLKIKDLKLSDPED